MATRKKRIRKPLEPTAEYGIVDTTKFGWCSGWENEQNHPACQTEFYSATINKLVRCACDCHKGK